MMKRDELIHGLMNLEPECLSLTELNTNPTDSQCCVCSREHAVPCVSGAVTEEIHQASKQVGF